MTPSTELNPLAPVFVPAERRELVQQPWTTYDQIPYQEAAYTTNWFGGDLIMPMDHNLSAMIMYPGFEPKIDNTVEAIEARHIFDQTFGCDPTSLEAWQRLCWYCGKHEKSMPQSIYKCKKWLSVIYVNIFDVVEAVRTNTVVDPYFDDEIDLAVYSKQTGKLCPAPAAYGNEIFQFLLRRKWARNKTYDMKPSVAKRNK